MAPVKLFIYDLSGGIARTMSRQLTGIQIDGIWHTSIVAFGKEVFYGQGIDICPPGGSHLGRPLETYDLGETEIDEDTFWEYINEMRSHYTAEKYHLLEFNCNSFTNDVAGFLTGGSIPSHIKDLPATVLSTPFGQSLRPMIDQMYRRPTPGAGAYPTPTATPPPSNLPSSGIAPQLASSLLQGVAAQAAGSSVSTGPSPTNAASLTSSLHISTNQASLDHIVSAHRATAVLITERENRSLELVLEQIARDNTSKVGSAFVKMDAQVGSAKEVVTKHAISSLPAVLLFRGKQCISQVSISEVTLLRSTLVTFLGDEFPTHPHASLRVPTVAAISTDPILYTQVPSAIDVPVSKLVGFIDAVSAQKPSPALEDAKSALKASFAPYLKRRFPPNSSPSAITGTSTVPVTADNAKKWATMTSTITELLPPSNIFPLVDLWRLAILDNAVAIKVGISVVPAIEKHIASLLAGSSPSDVSRPLLLTTLRLGANTFAHPTSTSSEVQTQTKDILIAGLLHTDVAVRTAAASLAFNIASRRHAPFRSAQKGLYNWAEVDRRDKAGEGEQEVELVVALLEATEREDNEEVVHRLVASLAHLIYLSPSFMGPGESELGGMLEVLAAKDKLDAKLVPGGCGAKGVVKPDIRKLVTEVASLCT